MPKITEHEKWSIEVEYKDLIQDIVIGQRVRTTEDKHTIVGLIYETLQTIQKDGYKPTKVTILHTLFEREELTALQAFDRYWQYEALKPKEE
jgi:hypothetical protein